MTRLRRPPYSARRPGGFTLIEILAAVAIFVTLAAMVAPAMYNFMRDQEAGTVVNDMVQVMRFAQQQAVFSRQPRTVVIDLKDNVYWIKRTDGEERQQRGHGGWTRITGSRQPRTLDTSDKLHATRLQTGYQFGSVFFYRQARSVLDDQCMIHFYPDGTATGTAILIQRLGDSRAGVRELAINVNRATGRVKQMDDEERGALFGY